MQQHVKSGLLVLKRRFFRTSGGEARRPEREPSAGNAVAAAGNGLRSGAVVRRLGIRHAVSRSRLPEGSLIAADLAVEGSVGSDSGLLILGIVNGYAVSKGDIEVRGKLSATCTPAM